MTNQFQTFKALHQQETPLLIGNVWNVQSARVFEEKKWSAIATSSAAVAETLGYEDEQNMCFEEYLFMVKRITASVSVPLSVDMEGGYGNSPEEICTNIAKLYKAGVSGINIEDSVVVDGKRSLVDAETFAKKLSDIVAILDNEKIEMFINVRSDAFLLGIENPVGESILRKMLYQNTGAHGLFFPCITSVDDIKKITENAKLPVSVMCMPSLPDFVELKNAGVKRISFGPFGYRYTYKKLETAIDKISAENNFSALFTAD
jgi:2-methylisocitrate lyase-like PEP mutase family enzyme